MVEKSQFLLPGLNIWHRTGGRIFLFFVFLSLPLLASSQQAGNTPVRFVQPGRLRSSSDKATEIPSSSEVSPSIPVSTDGAAVNPALPDAEDDELLIEPGDEDLQWTGEQFDYAQKIRRQKAQRQKYLQDVLAGRIVANSTAYLENGKKHPVKGDRNMFFWKYQFALIIAAIVGMYCVQLLLDFKGRGKMSLTTRPSTCLRLGANFRGLGETKLVSAARFLTCGFLHAHVFHLFSNVITLLVAWMYFSRELGAKDEFVWVYHWTFPIFLFTTFFGSVYSYQTTLRYTGFSIGASGGCLGSSAAFILLTVRFEGIPPHRRWDFFISVFSVLASCIPWDSLFSSDAGTATDLGAHTAGVIGGLSMALVLFNAPRGVNGEKMIDAGDICSLVLLGVLLLAYLEVAREYVVDGKELLVRAYVKWLNLAGEPRQDERRMTAPGRLHCEMLTEEYLYLLDNEKIEDDPETIINRLEKENKNRRQTLPDLGGLVY